jgi:hypothetical protein
MVKSELRKFKENNPRAYHGNNPWLDDLHIIEDQERQLSSFLKFKMVKEKALIPQDFSSSDTNTSFVAVSIDDEFGRLIDLHEKQEREIQKRGN